MSRPSLSGSRPAALLIIAGVEGIEALALVALAALAIAAGPGSAYPLTAYGVGGTLLIAAALLVAVAVGTLRARPWSRTAGFVWQIVQVLVGLYALQGEGAQPGIAVAAILPAALVLVLLFTGPVRDATSRPS